MGTSSSVRQEFGSKGSREVRHGGPTGKYSGLVPKLVAHKFDGSNHHSYSGRELPTRKS
jgi:hypothetical protein